MPAQEKLRQYFCLAQEQIADIYIHSSGLIASAGQTSVISITQPIPRDPTTDPDYLLLGHQSNVCCLNVFGDVIVSGSWDGTARTWKNWNEQYILEGHEQAVWGVLALTETLIITGE